MVAESLGFYGIFQKWFSKFQKDNRLKCDYQKHNEFNDMRVSFNMVRGATVMCNSDYGLLVTHINGIPRNN